LWLLSGLAALRLEPLAKGSLTDAFPGYELSLRQTALVKAF
jgi:hypothetical protein